MLFSSSLSTTCTDDEQVYFARLEDKINHGQVLTPREKQTLINTLWPEATDDPEVMTVAAKEGRSGQGQQVYDPNQAVSDAYAQMVNNGYGFVPNPADVTTQGRAGGKHATASYQNPYQTNSDIQKLWPSANTLTNSVQQKEAYPYVPVRSYSDALVPGLSHSSLTPSNTVAGGQYGTANQQAYPASVGAHSFGAPATPTRRQQRKSRRGRPVDAGAAKEGYGKHTGYGHSHNTGYGHSHNTGYGKSNSYGHMSGGYGIWFCTESS